LRLQIPKTIFFDALPSAAIPVPGGVDEKAVGDPVLP
jgi:hypothetical protein